jgi:hypothetical protein
MNGTTNPKMTAIQKSISSKRDEKSGVMGTFINQFPFNRHAMRRFRALAIQKNVVNYRLWQVLELRAVLHRVELRLDILLAILPRADSATLK